MPPLSASFILVDPLWFLYGENGREFIIHACKHRTATGKGEGGGHTDLTLFLCVTRSSEFPEFVVLERHFTQRAASQRRLFQTNKLFYQGKNSHTLPYYDLKPFAKNGDTVDCDRRIHQLIRRTRTCNSRGGNDEQVRVTLLADANQVVLKAFAAACGICFVQKRYVIMLVT